MTSPCSTPPGRGVARLRRSLGIVSATTLLGAAVLVGAVSSGVFGAFTATATATVAVNNTTDTLDLCLGTTADTTFDLSASNWIPGDTITRVQKLSFCGGRGVGSVTIAAYLSAISGSGSATASQMALNTLMQARGCASGWSFTSESSYSCTTWNSWATVSDSSTGYSPAVWVMGGFGASTTSGLEVRIAFCNGTDVPVAGCTATLGDTYQNRTPVWTMRLSATNSSGTAL